MPTKHERLKAFNEAKRAQRQNQNEQFNLNLQEQEDLARGDITDYFSNRGVTDLSPYEDAITRALADVREDIPKGLKTGISEYYEPVAADLYTRLSNERQVKAMRDIENLLPEGFEEGRISNTFDDSIIADILNEQRGRAEGYVQNLMDRGVINQLGYNAAIEDIMGQEPRIKGMLGDIGKNLIAGGRTDLAKIGDKARLKASKLDLGSGPFDPGAYAQDIENAFNEFTSGFGDMFRAQAGQGDLFTTSNLAARAGAGQGAQNFRFDPRALAGMAPEDEEEDNRQAKPIF